MKLFDNVAFLSIIVLFFITYVLCEFIHYAVEIIKGKKKKDEYNNL